MLTFFKKLEDWKELGQKLREQEQLAEENAVIVEGADNVDSIDSIDSADSAESAEIVVENIN